MVQRFAMASIALGMGQWQNALHSSKMSEIPVGSGFRGVMEDVVMGYVLGICILA